MANSQVLLSTRLHKHRKRRTKHSIVLRYGHMGRVHTSTVQASAKADVRFYPGRAYSAARLTVSRAARPAVRVRRTVLSGSTHVVESDGTH